MEAIDIGYRLFDCAYSYQNELQIGQGIRAKIEDGTVKREELTIVSKVWNTFHSQSAVYESCQKALQVFGLTYIDIYLIHWPMGFKENKDQIIPIEKGNVLFSDIDYLETWRGMENCFRNGLVKAIGVSNFNQEQLSRLIDKCFILPTINQIECNPHMNQSALRAFCKDFGIVIMAYAPLERGLKIQFGKIPSLFEEPILKQLQRKYKKTLCQIIIRYLIQLGTIPIPKTINKRRLKENINVFNFNLTRIDMEKIDTLNHNIRHYLFLEAEQHQHYPFDIYWNRQ
ncbi:1,5-anhydro-D-fructose reductase-like [Chrysoperla carnea]|uniref:1,5-anhydro-D-fructose reductase-like n=1 Tax=Chrysoperla carnea TaxID=189513 RepID=UPI001D07635C|nr:1,5-anhydro-D-fructose reductase-like [Chrysoperla carnea]